MATSVAASSKLWLAGIPITDSALRVEDAALFNHNTAGDTNILAVRTGVLTNGTMSNAVTTPGGMTVRLAPRTYIIQGTDTTTQGVYRVTNNANIDLDVASADPTYARLDRVCVTVTDNGDNTSTAVFQIITGTPAASPVLPTLPSNSCHIAQVQVPALAIIPTVVNDIVWTGINTGILPVFSSSSYPTTGPTSFINDLTLDQLMYFKAGVVYPAIRPYVCTSATRPTNKLYGTVIFETDTGCMRIWDSADWRVLTDTQWQTYTPVWSSTGTQPNIGNGTIVGRYFRTGKKIDVEIKMILGSTSTAGTGTYYWSLPAAPPNNIYAENIGTFVLNDSGGSSRAGAMAYTSGPKCYALHQTVVPTNQVVVTALTQATPLTWTNGDYIAIRLSYEI